MIGDILKAVKSYRMEVVFEELLNINGVGGFIAYEMVCDLRFCLLRFKPLDTITWANVGPGAKRGLNRLGMEPCIESMITLLNKAPRLECPWPFELREIEHWLCEFDKYERVRTGVGVPRMKYRPTTGSLP
jgi:hypothetical protein